MLSSNAIQFLASVADRQQYKSLFEDPNTLASICERIIVPNIEMRDVDVELFEDNPEEYIRRDLVRLKHWVHHMSRGAVAQSVECPKGHSLLTWVRITPRHRS